MLDKLKQEYNNNLERYYKGCKYCEENKDEIDRWMPELLKIVSNLEKLLDEIKKYQTIKKEEILKGFN